MPETPALMDRYTTSSGVVYLSGLQAIVRVMLDQHAADLAAGLRTATVVSGYPGSPVGGLDTELARHAKLLAERDIVAVPGVNEDLAATAVFGAQLAQVLPDPRFDGVLGLWFGKAPGVDRTIDAFRHGVARGVAKNGGILAVAGDDPAPKSSILPSDSRFAFQDLMMPVLNPADLQDVIELGLHGFALSRASGLGVGMKLVADVADSAGTVRVGPELVHPIIPTIEVDGVPFAHAFQPNLTGAGMREPERLLIQGRLEVARAYGRVNGLNAVHGASRSARLGLVASGKTYLDLLEALLALGIEHDDLERHGIRVMKVGMPYPLDDGELRAFGDGLEEILIVEEKRAFLEGFFKQALFGRPDCPRVVGRRDERDRPLVPEFGVLGPESIARIVAQRLDAIAASTEFGERAARLQRTIVERPALPIARIGTFCSGCPHTTSLKTPDGAVVGGGIGCHTMAIRQEREEFGTIVGYTQMGGEGAQWVGAAPFTPTEHFFQNLGDGTFAHSGSMAIRFAVSSGINITYKLLFNSVVAMTGGQSAVGGKDVAETIRLLRAEGVRKVVVTTEDPSRYRDRALDPIASVRHRDEILDVQRELAAVPGVTVLLHDQQCAIEKRRMRKRGALPQPDRHVVINERVCEGCGDCGRKSSCLSVVPVDTEFGRKTRIHQSSCTTDLSCLKGDCPSFLTVEPGRDGAERRRPLPVLPPGELPEPAPVVPTETFRVHLSGIGGTGVVTVNQILGVAAALDGRHVRALDQFGGSQKAGGVTSHLTIARGPLDIVGELPAGTADTLLVFDVLTATERANLAKADPARTHAVVSTERVATGGMVVDPTLAFPEMPVFARALDASTVEGGVAYVDAQQLAEELTGDHMATNLLVTGIAFERGLLPLPSARIEEAIRLGGIAVEMNVAAFRWGRMVAARPDLVDDARRQAAAPEPLAADPPVDPRVRELCRWADGPLRELLEHRGTDLVGYQDLRYAARYVAFVERMVGRASAAGVSGHAFSQTVATNLYKLMAYKDEYEVARLHLSAAARAAVERDFGRGAKVRWHLHPPMLRALGFDRKIVLGPWFAPAFGVLRSMRRLRGTALDPFGRAHVRRVERALVQEYVGTIERVVEQLTPQNASTAIEIAGLPDLIRGYEDIKLANVERYRARRDELVAALSAPAEPPVINVVQA